MRKILAVVLAVFQLAFLGLVSAKKGFDEKWEKKQLEEALENGVEVCLFPECVTISYTDDGDWLMTATTIRGGDDAYYTREQGRFLRLKENRYASKDGPTLYTIERPADGETTRLSFLEESYIDVSTGDYLLDRDAASAFFGADLDRLTPYGEPFYERQYDDSLGYVMEHWYWYNYDGKNEITVGGETYPYFIRAVLYEQRLFLTALVIGDRMLTLTRQHFEDDG